MLTFTDRAREMVLAFMEQDEDAPQSLRIEVGQGGSPLAPPFELTLVDDEDKSPEDVAFDAGSFTVLVPKGSVDRLEGATVDFVERLTESGFEVRPAAQETPEPPAHNGEEAEALAARVRTVLDNTVNPAIAAHGGRIDLARVEGTEVFMEMSGGCQGCAMSRRTLRQGVERMIRQSVPEVTAIHDVTDHSAGENPYFANPV